MAEEEWPVRAQEEAEEAAREKVRSSTYLGWRRNGLHDGADDAGTSWNGDALAWIMLM